MTVTNHKIPNKKIVAAFLIASASVALYGQATRGRPPENIVSGIASNWIINFFAALTAINYLAELISAKKYKELTAASLAALVLAAVQGLITKLEAKNEALWLQYASALSATFGNFVLYALSATNVSEFLRYLTNFRRKDLANLERLSVVLDVADYKSMPDVTIGLSNATPENEKYLLVLNTIMRLAKTVEKPAEFSPFLEKIIAAVGLIPKIALSVFMVYCMFAYSCGAAVSIEKDFGASQLVGAVSGFSLLSPLMLLGIKGGFTLGGVFNVLIANLLQYHTFPNAFKLDKVGVAATVLSPLLAILISCRSGDTTQILLGQCKNTLLHFFGDFLHASQIAYGSSAGFNVFYVLQIIKRVVAQAAKRYMGPEALNYLELAAVYKEMMDKAKRDSGFLGTLPSDNTARMQSVDLSGLSAVVGFGKADFCQYAFLRRAPINGSGSPREKQSLLTSLDTLNAGASC